MRIVLIVDYKTMEKTKQANKHGSDQHNSDEKRFNSKGTSFDKKKRSYIHTIVNIKPKTL